jgi:hypothetical protein
MRAWVVLLAVTAACGDSAQRPNDCKDGETRECYGGPPGTENIGPCRTGIESCSGGQWPGICIGDIVPLVENCNDFDDDCNGVIDDAATVGDACTGTNGCTGARSCSDNGSIRCFAPSRNECDLCNGPDITNVGDECISDDGCVGAFACSVDKTSALCSTPTKNECGVCGGPAVTGLGGDCMSSDNCPGTVVCNTGGTAAVCNAPTFNECGACFPPIGAAPGSTCTGDRGCVGATVCNGTGDALVCTLDQPCGHVVISELATGSSVCNTDEFIELYNPTSRTISLAGYTLRSRSASSGSFTRLITFGATATIASHGYFLVASARSSTGCSNNPSPGGGYPAVPGNTVAADATYSAVDVSGTVGGIWLTTIDQDPTGVTDAIVVDVLGYDENIATQPATVFEGTAPAPAPQPLQANGSLERKANATSTAVTMAAGGTDVTAGNAYDTDDNALNFVVQSVRVPQNTSSTPEP